MGETGQDESTREREDICRSRNGPRLDSCTRKGLVAVPASTAETEKRVAS